MWKGGWGHSALIKKVPFSHGDKTDLLHFYLPFYPDTFYLAEWVRKRLKTGQHTGCKSTKPRSYHLHSTTIPFRESEDGGAWAMIDVPTSRIINGKHCLPRGRQSAVEGLITTQGLIFKVNRRGLVLVGDW